MKQASAHTLTRSHCQSQSPPPVFLSFFFFPCRQSDAGNVFRSVFCNGVISEREQRSTFRQICAIQSFSQDSYFRRKMSQLIVEIKAEAVQSPSYISSVCVGRASHQSRSGVIGVFVLIAGTTTLLVRQQPFWASVRS